MSAKTDEPQYDRFSVPQLLDEATHLMRRTPSAGWAAYALGTLPFVIMLVYFWAKMTYFADAEQRLPVSAAGLVLGFIWMKTFQSVFCGSQLALLNDEHLPPMTLKRLLPIALMQTIAQGVGLVLLPFCLLLALPFGRMYAYYNSFTVFAAVPDTTYAAARAAAWDTSKRWRGQNMILIWLLSPWLLVAVAAIFLALRPGLATFLNPVGEAAMNSVLVLVLGGALVLLAPVPLMVCLMVATTLVLIPILLHGVLGVDTAFSMSPESFGHSSFSVLVVVLTYVLLDPFIRSAYTLRAFYGNALRSGQDLLAELSRERRRVRLGATLLLLLLLLLLPDQAMAQDEGGGADPAKVDQSIRDVFERPEYAWRTPRDERSMVFDPLANADLTWVEKIVEKVKLYLNAVGDFVQKVFKRVGEAFERLWKWLRNLRGQRAPPVTPAPSTPGALSGLMAFLVESFPAIGITLIVVVLGLVMYVVWRILRKSKAAEAILPKGDAVVVVTEEALAHDEIAPDALPESGWRAMAADLIDRGEYRLAMRALYLASLSFLGEHDLVALRKSKSNREYLRELTRRAHALPGLLGAFSENVGRFELAWYGEHPVTRDGLDAFITNLDRIRDSAQS